MRTYPRFTQETFPHTLVLANGAFPTAPTPLSLIDSWSQGKAGYTLTCCDGAVNKLRRYTELLPDAVIGDLDSVSPALKDLLAGRIQHFPDQETNDLTKTFRYLHSQHGKQSITLLGASGGREDHLLANLNPLQQTPISLSGVRWPLVDAILPALWCGSLNCAIEKEITVHTTVPILIYLANV